MKKKQTTTKANDAPPAVALPRPDVSDDDLVAAIAETGGLPTRVMDKFGMSLDDLLARAKASRKVGGAFIESKQRMVDTARAFAFKVAVGDAATETPPDPTMLRWIIKRYE